MRFGRIVRTSTLGWIFALLACSNRIGAPVGPPPDAELPLWIINSPEIEASEATNVFELIRERRPGWLAGYRTPVEPGGDGGEPFAVYVAEERVPGLLSLRDVPTEGVGSVRLVSRALAENGGYPVDPGQSAAILVAKPTLRFGEPELTVFPVGFPLTDNGAAAAFRDAGLVDISFDPDLILPLLLSARMSVGGPAGIEILLGEGGAGRVNGTDEDCAPACSTGINQWEYSSRIVGLLAHYRWRGIRFGAGLAFTIADYRWRTRMCSSEDRCVWDTRASWSVSRRGWIGDVGYSYDPIPRVFADIKLQGRYFPDVESPDFFGLDSFTQRGLALMIGLGVRP
ncbi:MAG: hypothetical protein ACODAE_04050 [Gemmatimonadota bacterium]